MRAFIDPDLLKLNDCGCCEGISVQTPGEVYNRPGLGAIAYRVGMHSQFKQSLLAKLAKRSDPALSPLQALTTRNDDDFLIALLDAWATVADVLTFYQERIANESYLRTATERFSILQLARLIDYELNPGVAASTPLAFTVEDGGQRLMNEIKNVVASPYLISAANNADASPRTIIDIGTKVQSVAGPGEQAQVFETVEKIEARAEWNAIKPQLTQPQNISKDTSRIWVKGITTQLKPGDGVLIISASDDGKLFFGRVKQATLDSRLSHDAMVQQTIIDLEVTTNNSSVESQTALPPLSSAQQTIQKLLESGHCQQSDLIAFAQIHRWDETRLKANIAALQNYQLQASTAKVFVFRTIANLFGYNAQPNLSLSPQGDEDDKKLFLDNVYAAITASSSNVYAAITASSSTAPSYIAVLTPDISSNSPIISTIQSVITCPRTAYEMTGKITVLTLASPWRPNNNDFNQLIRGTIVYAQSESLELINAPNPSPIGPNGPIVLNDFYPDLQVGQSVILTGQLCDRNETQSELVTLSDVKTTATGYTQISLLPGLQNAYIRETVTINANIAIATHGETAQEEILGSGRASQPYQKFILRQPPLTYLSAATARGTKSTLEVWVNHVLWQEVPSLYGKSSLDRVYVTQQSNDGQTTIEFGDGNTGSRLPTGVDNVRAIYRKGIGLGGNVKAGQLSLLMSHPLRVKGVTNPLPANGGDDPESPDQARQNAPLKVLTLDRIVSLKDYEDFAHAFGGVAKALATWSWMGQQRGVVVTVAGPKGGVFNPGDQAYDNLLTAMRQAGDPHVPLQVVSYRKAFFRLQARVKVAPDASSQQVVAGVRKALEDRFSFDACQFGRGIALSEAIAVMQSVSEVIAVDVDQFYRLVEVPAGLPKPLTQKISLQRSVQLGDSGYLHTFANALPTSSPCTYLPSAAPQVGSDGMIRGAELLILDPHQPPRLEVMA